MSYEDQVHDAVVAGGINNVYTYDEVNDISNMKINFEELFTNSLENGEYTIKITATDVLGKSCVKTLTLIVSDAPRNHRRHQPDGCLLHYRNTPRQPQRRGHRIRLQLSPRRQQ